MTTAVILAGGRGTRLAEETSARPKPMVEIGRRPILWHIMKIYAAHGVTDFVICLGYMGFLIKEFFVNYHLHEADVSVDLNSGAVSYHRNAAEPWRVTLIDTGDDTQTGGRLKRVARYLDPTEPFCLTYGDGVGDVDVTALLAFHRTHGRLATVTAVAPPGRFGALARTGERVTAFMEKPLGDGGAINGGFFVLSPTVLERIPGDATVFEKEPLESLAADGQLCAYDHPGFWQPMDTLRDKLHLEELWRSGAAPWKIW
ncbi:glucose-1-phosphate cytidylyltransferase [Microvirga alba]|uniref:Glucose-1-phosphate cytidylyltransferase n=1 Tax=Microvirga alba TaxID=2791025 RepID=A0A931FMB5_9HYPH|nr:glucose-1-phosphate cytidylyltransferase [Microvirga alba]MBF9232924.1 glucose-1-phosphate cytidylyltransferase [Microvirga alba]